MPPKLSVVAPVLNEKENLRELLEDIDDFEFKDYEVLIVDGGSSDGTRKVAKEFGARIVDGPQEGMAAARNKCIEEARGEYILMVDADFRFPDGLPGDINELLEKDLDIIGWGTDFSAQRALVEKIYAAEYQMNFNNTILHRLFSFLGGLNG